MTLINKKSGFLRTQTSAFPVAVTELSGYGEEVVQLLNRAGASLFSKVRVKLREGMELVGLVMPRPRFGDDRVVVLKLENGYNIGIAVDRIVGLKLEEDYSAENRAPTPLGTSHVKDLPVVVFLGTGGTIASRVDYVTGAVYPYFTAEELYSMIPELEDIAVVRTETLFSIFSEDMTPGHWSQLCQRIAEIYEKDAPAGIVVAHGTDTMHYSASAVAFAVRQLPGPVVFTGAQRSSDRPSSDAAVNVIGASLTAVAAPFAESVIAMHGGSGDEYVLVHRGVRARKMHSSRRDAFMSINSIPLAKVDIESRKLTLLMKEYKPRSDEVEVYPKFCKKVALVKFYPGMEPEILEFFHEQGYRGIVIEGTGLGHIRSSLIKNIASLVKDGVFVAMATQCLWGRVNMNVYRTGVELLKAGVVPVGDMLPETAFVKLSWVLGQTDDLDEARKLFTENLAYELNSRTEYATYPGASWWERCR